MGKDSYSAVQDVERFTRRMCFVAGKQRLSQRDAYNLRFAFSEAYLLLLDILPAGDPGLHAFSCFLAGTLQCDVLRVAKTLKDCSDLLVQKVSAYSPPGPVLTMLDFKRLAATAGLYKGLVTPIATLVENADPLDFGPTFRCLFQWFEFLRHINVLSLDLSHENETCYLAFEDDVATWSYDPAQCDSLSLILDEWCRTYSAGTLWPEHGPGAIAAHKGRLGWIGKDQVLETDARLQYCLARTPESFPFFPSQPHSTLIRQNEIVFVPKKMDKNRVISKEPCTLAYFQQAVYKRMCDTVFTVRSLKGHVALSNQSKSVDLAWEGSVTGKYATLDLSNASDSVSLSLIKRCVLNPDLRRDLICTRSDEARLPSGTVVRLRKFAPMGSAVCFPIETLTFAAICEMAVREVSGRASYSYEYQVYGDDIVIRAEYVSRCLELLKAFHFTVNSSKSFWQTSYYTYREACGGYFLNGMDVTPLRLSRRLALMPPNERDRQIGPRVSLISLCNELLARGYLQARLGAISQLKMYYPGLRGIPFSPLDEEALPFALQTYRDSCTNFNCSRRPSLPQSEWWGTSTFGVFDVVSKCDAKLLATVVPVDRVDLLRYYEYWRARAANLRRVASGGTDEYAPQWGVSFAPETRDLRPQRTYDVRKWRVL